MTRAQQRANWDRKQADKRANDLARLDVMRALPAPTSLRVVSAKGALGLNESHLVDTEIAEDTYGTARCGRAVANLHADTANRINWSAIRPATTERCENGTFLNCRLCRASIGLDPFAFGTNPL